LDYEKQVSAGARAKFSIGSFLPFSTASTDNDFNRIARHCALKVWRAAD